MTEMKVVALGSINLDLVVEVPHLPRKGETVVGKNFFTVAGGKGANQAVAVAKLGVGVDLVGLVGSDEFGLILLQHLQDSGITTDNIRVDTQTHSGIGSIVVDEWGDNAIACAAGANKNLTEEDVQRFTSLLEENTIILLELGIPLPTVVAAAQAAHSKKCRIILDPAPARSDLPEELYPLLDIITPNEVEATQLVGFTVDGVTTAKKAAEILQQKGVKNVIITLGSQGLVLCTQEDTIHLPAIPVEVVDTVAAGDGFNGGLAAALASGKTLAEAVQWGRVAGALTVTKKGAQPSLPDQESFMQLLSEIERE